MKARLPVLAAIALSALALGAGAFPAIAQPRCGALQTIRVNDLDMTPDPLPRGQAVQRWLAKVEVTGAGECPTRLRVRERDQVASAEIPWTFRPGLNVIPIPGNPGFRLAAANVCFHLAADIQGSPRPLDGARPCAKAAAGGTPPSFTLR